VLFLVDECTGPAVARWLRSLGHDVFSVFEQARGIADGEVLRIAQREERILITNDKGFGERVFRHGSHHCGVILLRLEDERSAVKIEVLERILEGYSDQLEQCFAVATEDKIRLTSVPSPGSRNSTAL
jgi:predicted nuclease of predicted toxin-antitoxin system